MTKIKTLLVFVAIMIVSSFVLPLSIVYADSPPPPNFFYSYVTNTDSSVKYTDILVKNIASSNYTDLNTANANAYGFTKTTPIVAYNQDGYQSISFHCKNAESRPDSPPTNLGLCKYF